MLINRLFSPTNFVLISHGNRTICLLQTQDLNVTQTWIQSVVCYLIQFIYAY